MAEFCERCKTPYVTDPDIHAAWHACNDLSTNLRNRGLTVISPEAVFKINSQIWSLRGICARLQGYGIEIVDAKTKLVEGYWAKSELWAPADVIRSLVELLLAAEREPGLAYLTLDELIQIAIAK